MLTRTSQDRGGDLQQTKLTPSLPTTETLDYRESNVPYLARRHGAGRDNLCAARADHRRPCPLVSKAAFRHGVAAHNIGRAYGRSEVQCAPAAHSPAENAPRAQIAGNEP
jgi:hypothetical protein